MSDLSFIGQQIPEEEEGEAVLAVISGYHPQAGWTAVHRIQLEVVGEGVHVILVIKSVTNLLTIVFLFMEQNLASFDG